MSIKVSDDDFMGLEIDGVDVVDRACDIADAQGARRRVPVAARPGGA
jgi:hypothetical protein